MISIYIIVILLCGVNRALVGAGKYVSRGWSFPLVGLVAALAGPAHILDAHSLWVLMPFGLAWLTLTSDIVDWNDREYMASHMSAGPFLAAVSAVVADNPVDAWHAITWAWACLCVGFFYADMIALFQAMLGDSPPQIRAIRLDANRIVEFIAGAVVQGGVVLLGVL